MAKTKQTDVLTRLADAGEEVLSRLASSSGMDRVTGAVTNLKDQVDALASKVRGMEKLEKRVGDLERKVERLSKSSGSSSRKTATARKTSSQKKS
jgi:polyhydroxyalkanoate synthesis regulator phasin